MAVSCPQGTRTSNKTDITSRVWVFSKRIKYSSIRPFLDAALPKPDIEMHFHGETSKKMKYDMCIPGKQNPLQIFLYTHTYHDYQGDKNQRLVKKAILLNLIITADLGLGLPMFLCWCNWEVSFKDYERLLNLTQKQRKVNVFTVL